MSARHSGRPLQLNSASRRRLLKLAAASGLLAAIDRNVALAQSAADYKALVCIFQQGGNDGENTLVRYDTAGYQNYAAIRTPASGINLPQAQLLPVQPARGGPAYGFHPACAGWQDLFAAKKLAVVANVGMLVQPTTRAGLQNGGAARPANLFAHNSQEVAAQTAVATGVENTGWGGRMADRLDAANPGSLFPPLTSMAGMRPFVSGRTSVPLSVPRFPSLALSGSGNGQFQFNALRDAAVREMLAQNRSNLYDSVAQVYAEEGMAAASVALPILQNSKSVVAPFFSSLTSLIAGQLSKIALMIEGRGQTQLRRQVFFAQQGTYDTHDNQPVNHATLLGDLAKATKAFQDAMEALGLGNAVTTCTLSEFGRTFKPGAGSGTDHGWGNYMFVIGGAVRGGDLYGTPPVQAPNGPDDFDTAGRWIPSTSIEQYGATLARWFGIAEGDLPYVFPNIGAFPNTNLGFMA
jgi:uncharacterized protein (DUF1501 family)